MSREAVKQALSESKATLEAQIADLNSRIATLQAQTIQLQSERDDAVRKVASFDETIADVDAKGPT